MFEHKPLYNIIHPFIDSIYIKKEFDLGARESGKDILVIETKRNRKKITRKSRDEQLLSFLADIDLIKDAVEKKAGKFDRLDIKYR